MTRARPEVLAPAGDRAALEAAVSAGADAVYFGLPAFNARARATNVPEAELAAVMAHLRRHGVKGYVAAQHAALRQRARGGRAGHPRAAPRRVSTPSSSRTWAWRGSAGGRPRARAARLHADDLHRRRRGRARPQPRAQPGDPGPRALARRDRGHPPAPRRSSSRSSCTARCASPTRGQCLTSEAIGGRSANRGACAQACRLPYELLVDGAVASWATAPTCCRPRTWRRRAGAATDRARRYAP